MLVKCVVEKRARLRVQFSANYGAHVGLGSKSKMAEGQQVDDVLSLYESCIHVINSAFALINVKYLEGL